ncbi:MAG: two-component system, OmpR family, sensor histidine kinase PrrB [Solirubrobacteraceae bacterium]|nr:two-component system, OmpR family, sensor histidine kinase PrrB [Solirubrobacteraceae bacterium]
MRLPRSLAARVTLAAVVAVGAALLVGGLAVVLAAERSDRDALDHELERLVQARRGPALRILGPGGPGAPQGPGRVRRGPVPGPDGPPFERGGGPPPLDPGSDRFVRVISPEGRTTAAGATVPADFPLVEPNGPRTVTVAGRDWRTVTRRLPGGGTLQAAARLGPLQARATRLRQIVAIVAALALLATALTAGGLVRLALAPLRRLRSAAEQVADTADLSVRVPADDGPEEVRELAGDLNAMLERLGASAAEREAALTAARRFAADAGHELRTPLTSLEANLSTLGAAGGAPPALTASQADARRLGALVEQLQALARGEAGAPAAPEEVDAAELVDSALAGLRVRHPGVEASLEAPDPGPAVHGDAEGLRMLVDNLLENAARHGRADGRIAAAVSVLPGGGVRVTVDDDGPGIPAAERQAVLRRFVRGQGARGPGSGLGLAIAAAQAQRHGGSLRIEDSPLGGARAVAEVPGVNGRPGG